ncbi:MAG: hypothetical protein H5T72_06250 [Actinobacteria bacterium]|nr:hypothetical protein [Actinomycetota bacterium]
MRGSVRVGVLLLASLLCLFMVPATTVHGAPGDFRAACGTSGWYFAEGFTGGDFDTWILIQNPNQEDTVATLRFFTPAGELQPLEVPLGGETRTTVYLNGLPELEAGCEVATEVRVEGSGIVAERAMYFNYGGRRAGGHCSIGASGPASTWYLPEGYTGGEFDTYVLLMNPGDEDADGVWLKLMKPDDGRYYPFKLDVPAGRRVTVKLDDLVWTEGSDNYIASTYPPPPGSDPLQVRFDDTPVSTWIISGKPLVAERAMYFEYYGKAGGSSSIGTTSPAPVWYLPEGYTGGDFDTWVMAMNPNSYPVDITYTFFSNQPGSEPVSVTHEGVPAYSRDTLFVDQVPGLEGTDVSTMVRACPSGGCSGASSSEDAACIVAERTVYFRYEAAADGATSIGTPSLFGRWFLAEGYTGGGFDTYVLVMNPNDCWVKITATYMTPEGAEVVKEYPCPPRYRYTIKVDDQDPSLASADVSTRIEAEYMEDPGAEGAGCREAYAAGVAVERAMYFVYRSPDTGKVMSGGTCSIGFGE